MPPEVATEMLLAPCAKTTNTFRKTCRAARAKYLASTAPIMRNPDDDPEYVYSESKAKTWAIRAAARAAGASLRQLVNWERRARSKACVHLRKALRADGTDSIYAVEYRALAHRLTEWADMCAGVRESRQGKREAK